MRSRLFSVLIALNILSSVLALGEERVITFPNHPSLKTNSNQVVFSTENHSNTFLLASASLQKATPLLLDSEDDEAIHVAAQTFANDVYRVTGLRPEMFNNTLPGVYENAIVIGSISSRLVRNLHGEGSMNSLRGKWESFDVRVREKPLKGVEEGLVVIGSDRVSFSHQTPS